MECRAIAKAQTSGLEVRFWKVALGFWTDDGQLGSNANVADGGIRKVPARTRFAQ
jgi:hypothetical protein